MDSKIKAKYEVLLNDLINHDIGEFLSSRSFKLFMIKNNLYEKWDKIHNDIKSNRTIFSLGYDYEKENNIKTLAVFFNLIDRYTDMEDIITKIILEFINDKKTNEDFSNIIEAMEISGFSEKSINNVKNAYDKHKSLKLPEKEAIKKEITYEMKQKQKKLNKKDIFIVHGHNNEIKEKVARTLEKLKLNPIILNEQSNESKTIIEKLEKYSKVNYAIILLTYDDYGNLKSNNKKNKRARQNVILELGYFLAKIERENILILYEKGVELPSDISGMLYIEIDDKDNWKFRLIKELRTAGFNVDANIIL